MKLKPGVTVQGIRPELVLGIMAADGVFAANGFDCVVTSLTDGLHARTSLHYAGCAADFRTSHPSLTIPASTVQAIAGDLRRALGADYDVVVERDHLHLEYQPKRET